MRARISMVVCTINHRWLMAYSSYTVADFSRTLKYWPDGFISEMSWMPDDSQSSHQHPISTVQSSSPSTPWMKWIKKALKPSPHRILSVEDVNWETLSSTWWVSVVILKTIRRKFPTFGRWGWALLGSHLARMEERASLKGQTHWVKETVCER